jgi:7-carboxy-7-deazaguanine synthase
LLTVNEIFYSIQGESTRAGRPCVFVRLTACDLRCSWCDTGYAFHEGRKMSVDEVVAEVDRHNCSLVEITGGEPLLQEDVYPLMDRLLAEGRTVMLETGGHRPIARVPADGAEDCRREVSRQRRGRQERLGQSGASWSARRGEVRREGSCRLRVRARRHRAPRSALARSAVLISPVHGVLDPKTLSEWMLADHLAARLQLQIHKYIWPPETRGV